MNKIVTVGLLSAALSACVGPVGTGSSSSDTVSSDNVQPSSSSVTTVSSSSAPVSSSSSSTASSQPSFNGNAIAGKATFGTNCAVCHSDTDNDGYFGGSGDSAKIGSVDPDDLGSPAMSAAYDGGSINALAAFIGAEMAPSNCGEQCINDTAAYIWSLRDGKEGESAVAVSCANPGAIHYGKRTLHVLTSYEYGNSLQQLFGAPLPADYSSIGKVGLDVEVARLPNHSSTALAETRLNSYYDNATEITDWAMSTPGALPFACDDAVSCATDFITEFAYVAYRRALTDEEQAEITDIFTGAADVDSGLKWALTTVLMSPNFLYRSELGTQVSELLANPVVAPGTDFDFAGTPQIETDVEIQAYQNTHLRGYSWTGDDLIAITAIATARSDGGAPVLSIGRGYNAPENPIAVIDVRVGVERTYYVPITEAYSNEPPVGIFNDVTRAGGHSEGGSVTITRLAYGKLGVAEAVEDDVEKLMAADQSAYALDPYEYASALSFALTGSGPSKSLLDAAVAGELVDESDREQHIDALIDSDMGKAHVERLAGKWFRTDGLMSKTRNDSEFTNDVRRSMMQEIREIYKHVFYNGDFPSMYEGDFTFLDSTLASFYGITGGGSSNGDFRYVDTTGQLRGGVIASGAYMAYNAHMDYTSPIQRSAHFRQDVLCQAIPLPVNLEDSAEREAAAQTVQARVEAGDITTADYYDIQTNIPGSSCASCHNAIINPLFGMDDFDNVGRLRSRVNGDTVQSGLKFNDNNIALPEGDSNLPISQVNQGSYLYSYNVVGTLSGAQADAAKESGDGLRFFGAKDLGRVIVENDVPGIGACLIEKSTRFALGWTLGKEFLEESENGYYGISDAQEAELACIQDELESAYAGSKSPRDVLKALVMSDAFRFRK
ncbi:DUF1592 domain-containing protein [Marinagarivorans cellulosilyticus]|uniref:Cytochrome c domain-containing protein n=1 Tax=Marinagarivorans cellulosilyticus TaxID=2721545 RepID=A0AAN1WKW9_9GAMM|nr:DUF1592 domain-containing protein [Marinagarivorans cellulosilyticus]BCD99487.1 hypothetical protein MARGE09_P3689 [Marinagarivorans cellulosilyticus]